MLAISFGMPKFGFKCGDLTILPLYTGGLPTYGGGCFMILGSIGFRLVAVISALLLLLGLGDDLLGEFGVFKFVNPMAAAKMGCMPAR